jgi:hypothetical protein
MQEWQEQTCVWCSGHSCRNGKSKHVYGAQDTDAGMARANMCMVLRAQLQEWQERICVWCSNLFEGEHPFDPRSYTVAFWL